jgi:hypothetical protein
MGTRSKRKSPPKLQPPTPPPQPSGLVPEGVVLCWVDEGKPSACGQEVGSGGSKSARLCSRHYSAWKRHPERPLVGRPEKVAGQAGEQLRSVVRPDLLVMVDALRGTQSRSAWIATAVEERVGRGLSRADRRAIAQGRAGRGADQAGVRLKTVLRPEVAKKLNAALGDDGSVSAWINGAIQAKARRETTAKSS